MKNKLYTRIVVIGLITLLLGTSFITISGTTTNEEQTTNVSRGNTFNVTAGQPTKNGKWTIHITHTGTTPNGTPYRNGTWTFSIPTNPGMTPAQKAEKMKEEINKRNGCPLSATSSGSNVKVTAANGNINKWSSSSTDGQFVHGTTASLAAFSFMGTPTIGSVTIDAGGFLAMTPTNGKTLVQIHNDLTVMLLGFGVPTMIDPSGLALYILAPFPNIGLDSDDDGLASYGVFYENPSIEPFGVYVGMHDTFAGNSGSSVAVEFEISNFIFIPNTYHVTATDQQGWNIIPEDFICELLPGESSMFEFQVDIPAKNFAPTNIMNVTAIAINMSWIIGSGLAEIYVNNPPDTPVLDGQTNGKIGTEYTYTFTAVDPDGDDIYYCINWSDGTPEVCIGPFASGEEATATHTWSVKGTYLIKAKARDVHDAESDWGTLEVSMPTSYKIPMHWFWERILERFPHAFPILRHLLGY
ncbi:MAG TPA: PKD domain-containing protein [Candidatus Thermoplasmatota archaeon]|nr:PKD domain-containing protein [Candidatus Thermoplasmatota archaeon]